MSRICENFKLGANGVCENYIESTKKSSCSYSCKIYEAKGNKKSEIRKLLDNQIIGILVPYETEVFNHEIRRIKRKNRKVSKNQ